MTTEKLTLEHVAPYLPYGLRGNLINNEYYEPVIAGELYRIETGITTSNTTPDPFVIVADYEDNVQFFTPILYRMDLTKSIQVDGKEVIPIVELAKIAWTNREWKLYACPVTEGLTAKHENFYFLFDNHQSPTMINLCQSDNSFSCMPVDNQFKIFQWLFKHKFDVFRLIEKGLAVDVNTLETNPYEPSPITNK